MVDLPPSEPPKNPAPKQTRKSARERLDVLVLALGLAPSRERARAVIMAGAVRVNGHVIVKPGTLVPLDGAISLAEASPALRYASRGGLKLEHALDVFALDPLGLICLDVGASTGGFTDVLLRRGARRVYAVDVGRGQLAWSLRNDERVVVMERTNIRHLASLPETVACAVIDVSFISLRLVLPAVAQLVALGGWIMALFKPQFEAGRAEADRGAGVISDPVIHERILREFVAWCGSLESGIRARGLAASPITGRDGNREYLFHLEVRDPMGAAPAILGAEIGETRIAAVVEQAFERQTRVQREGT